MKKISVYLVCFSNGSDFWVCIGVYLVTMTINLLISQSDNKNLIFFSIFFFSYSDANQNKNRVSCSVSQRIATGWKRERDETLNSPTKAMLNCLPSSASSSFCCCLNFSLYNHWINDSNVHCNVQSNNIQRFNDDRLDAALITIKERST